MLPPPAAGLQVVSIDSLEAALAKMDIKVSVKDILPVIREVEEAKRAQPVAQAANRRATLSNRKSPATAARLLPFSLLSFNPSNMLVALHPPEQSSGLRFTTTSHFVRHPPRPEMADPLAKERRRRLLELTKQTFPDGGVPDPFTLT
jgi:hypothetical protein